MSVEPGYVSTRDHWGRIETSVEVGTGKFNFRRKGESKENVNVNVGFLALAKIGYGWSLGQTMFGVIKAGAGPIMATYDAKTKDDVKIKSDGAITGIVGQLSYELVMPQSSSFDMVGGIRHNYVPWTLMMQKWMA